jgi:DNA-binding transcriptional MerR regulator
MSDEPLLTIGQLADYVGVTIRAVRHYHQRGLLPEPGRDASGYRRYGAQAVLDLMRIKVLAEAGVPLARIDELLAATPAQLATAIAEIDAQLERQIAELQRRHHEVTRIGVGERAFLPPELADYLDELHAAGVGPRTVQLERDGWLLLIARKGEEALAWLQDKREHFADPEFQRLTRTYDDAYEWEPDDPRLAELADAMIAYVRRRYDRHVSFSTEVDDPTLSALLGSIIGKSASPGIERLHELVTARHAGGC